MNFMNDQFSHWATVDEAGRVIIPPETAARLGIKPGSQLRLEEQGNQIRLHRPADHLNKVYIEPTTLCNLDCTMCVRNGWEETLGRMTEETFECIFNGLKELDSRPTVFFGGIGEPLYHPSTVRWIARVKELGCKVELITNGTTLTERRARQLVKAGLDVLWVSIDGATPEHYADVRLGAQLPHVLENLDRLRRMRSGGHFPKPVIGIAFVAMRKNIQDLPTLLTLGRQLGATLFNVSNVMPYTEDMQAESLFTKDAQKYSLFPSPMVPHLSLPKMDLDEFTQDAFIQAVNSGYHVNFAGNSFSNANDICNFIQSGSMSIAFDGFVSPCWPLMHTHTSYLHNKARHSRRHTIANVRERSLLEIWNDPGYFDYRQKVQGFRFAPCTFCGGCEMSEANDEDCIGNEFPACGGCLWSQGVIQCP